MHAHRLLWLVLAVTGCAQVTQPNICLHAEPGDPCVGRWACEPSATATSSGTHLEQLACVDGAVALDTWMEPPEPTGPQPSLPTSCDPSLPGGAMCGGDWRCPEWSVEGSTGTHYYRSACVGGAVTVGHRMEPFAPLANPIASCGGLAEGDTCEAPFTCPPIELGGGQRGTPVCDDGRVRVERWRPSPIGASAACRVSFEETVAENAGCRNRPSITFAGDDLRMAWGTSDAATVARRQDDGWYHRRFFPFGARRLDVAGEATLYSGWEGRASIFFGESNEVAHEFFEPHEAADGVPLTVGADGVLHGLMRETRTSGFGGASWVTRALEGSLRGGLTGWDLSSSDRDRPLDVVTDPDGEAAYLYATGEEMVFSHDGRTERLGPMAERWPPTGAAPRVAVTRGRVHHLGTQGLPGTRGASAHRLHSRIGGVWTAQTLAVDVPLECPDRGEAIGDRCRGERTHHGPGALVRLDDEVVVLYARHHAVIEAEWTCPAPDLLEYCSWQETEIEATHELLAMRVGDGIGLRPVAGLALGAEPSWTAVAHGERAHLGLAARDISGENGCDVRHVELRCD